MALEAVTRRRRVQTGEDRYGAPIYEPVDEVLPGRALFDPGGSREPVEVGREPVVTNPKLFFRNQWPDITSDDVLIVRGREYTVQGDPADWRNERDFGGLVVELQKASG